ncbi:MAG: OsmC domain/YcaO domain-containing protein [Oligoflexia bacterium]|nr:OsmC domain/YcaO domain-containing protein [Oligoflexia bacterium]
MQVNVRFLDNLRLEASFDDFKIMTDQPVRYKGDGTAPGPYDYFLASSALCAAYFVKVYCKARDISTEDIRITQNNIVDPDNRYHQDLHLQIELPDYISEKDKAGMLAAMDRCTVKRVIQNSPKFVIEEKNALEENTPIYTPTTEAGTKTMIVGKDCSLEETIENMTGYLRSLGINIEIASWRNQVPHVWSVHIRDADSPMCFSNGKGATKDAALCSALGEYLERISTNYFYSDYFLGDALKNADHVHYPNERWFSIPESDELPTGLMDEYLISLYNNEGELKASHLRDTNSGLKEKGICAVPYTRQSDGQEIYIPVNLIANLFVSNGMSAGNTKEEARVQALSEIFERAVKNQIITEEISLPDVPQEVLNQYPTIVEGIKKLEEQGFPILVKDASLGGKYPVMCVVLMNPRNGGVFPSFGAHPKFEVALERSLTELLQGRSFEGMNDTFPPTFNEFAVKEHNNIVDHFIDSTGVISWKFFSSKSEFEFHHWNFSGTTAQENDYLMGILKELEKEVYIADFEDLGANACRILVPNYSEIYLAEDLVWDNHNRALDFREDILNSQSLDQVQLKNLIERLEESELDDYMPISELIGIAFDEASTWGQLTIGEFKALSYLLTQNFFEAKQLFENLTTFSDTNPERKRFFQLMNILLDIVNSEELEIDDYQKSLCLMYGEKLFKDCIDSIEGKTKFYGLSQINSQLDGIDKHQRLLESYSKLQKARSTYTL